MLKGKRHRLKNQSGFGLIELMIAAALGSVLIFAAYDFFISMEKCYRIQNQVVDLQNVSRISIGMINEDLRKACYDPTQSGNFKITTAKIKIIEFGFDANEDGILDANSNEELAYRQNGDTLEVKTYDAYGSLRWEEVAEKVNLTFTYYDGDGNQISYTNIDGGTSEQAARDEIKSVHVSLTLRTAREDPAYLGGPDIDPDRPGTCRTRTLNNLVEIRNQ